MALGKEIITKKTCAIEQKYANKAHTHLKACAKDSKTT